MENLNFITNKPDFKNVSEILLTVGVFDSKLNLTACDVPGFTDPTSESYFKGHLPNSFKREVK
jgi:hypothetical protein